MAPQNFYCNGCLSFSYLIYIILFMHNCPVKGCAKTCKSAYGLTQHVNAIHQHLPHQFPSKTSSRKWVHPFLTGEFNHLITYIMVLIFVIVQLAPVIEVAPISLQMPIPHHLNRWMLLTKTPLTHSWIVLLSNLLIFTFPNFSAPRQVLIEPWTSGKLKLQNMVRMCLGVQPGIFMPRLMTYGKAIIHGYAFHFTINLKASYHQTHPDG